MYLKADYPIKFINSVVNEFCNETETTEDSYIIPTNFQCAEDYTGGTEQNTKTRWSEHNNLVQNSETARHIFNNIDHIITWTILAPAPKKRSTRKAETLFIAQLKPPLKEQKKFNRFIIFKNGITQ